MSCRDTVLFILLIIQTITIASIAKECLIFYRNTNEKKGPTRDLE